MMGAMAGEGMMGEGGIFRWVEWGMEWGEVGGGGN